MRLSYRSYRVAKAPPSPAAALRASLRGHDRCGARVHLRHLVAFRFRAREGQDQRDGKTGRLWHVRFRFD